MPEEVVQYICQYGYLAIFLLVFMQEIGAPNPIPNEFLLLFSGYLIFSGALNALAVIAAAIGGDLLAAGLVYLVFYHFGQWMEASKWTWLARFVESLRKRCDRLPLQKLNGLAIGRLSPFIRGYVAAASGLVRVRPGRYSWVVFLTTVLWACFYVGCGYRLGPYWAYVNKHVVSFKYMLWLILLFFIALALVRHFAGKNQNQIL